jgi:hypothetical protein
MSQDRNAHSVSKGRDARYILPLQPAQDIFKMVEHVVLKASSYTWLPRQGVVSTARMLHLHRSPPSVVWSLITARVRGSRGKRTYHIESFVAHIPHPIIADSTQGQEVPGEDKKRGKTRDDQQCDEKIIEASPGGHCAEFLRVNGEMWDSGEMNAETSHAVKRRVRDNKRLRAQFSQMHFKHASWTCVNFTKSM